MPSRLFPPASDDVLVIVDFSSHLFRAYHAIRPLSSPTGEPTHAVYGAVTMLERLVKEVRPKRLAIALDSGRKTFRSDIYADYKANRPAPPDDLVQQLNRACEVVRAFTPHVWQKEGYEADDLIATAVRRARAAGLRTLIVGADKDLMQLVGDDVLLWDTMRDCVIGIEEVFAKFQVRVDQLGDLLALMGDSSDNIPGVAGVGPKTAAELLAAHESLDGIYGHLSELPKKRIRDLLAQHEANARLSRTLGTLADDCDASIDPIATVWSGRDVKRLRAIYQDLGFTRLAQSLAAEVTAEPASIEQRPDVASEGVSSVDEGVPVADSGAPASTNTQSSFEFLAETEKFDLLDTTDSLEHWLNANRAATKWALALRRELDHATHSPCSVIALATSETSAAVIPVATGSSDARAKGLEVLVLRRVLEAELARSDLEVHTHGLKTLWLALFDLQIEQGRFTFDTELASYLLDPEQVHDLATLSQRYLGKNQGPSPQPAARAKKPATATDQQLHADMALRARSIFRLSRVMAPRIFDEGLGRVYYQIELPLCRVLARMQRLGVLVDVGALATMSTELDREIARLEAEAISCAGQTFNVNSPRQLETILFDQLGLKPVRRTKTSRSTAAAPLA